MSLDAHIPDAEKNIVGEVRVLVVQKENCRYIIAGGVRILVVQKENCRYMVPNYILVALDSSEPLTVYNIMCIYI